MAANGYDPFPLRPPEPEPVDGPLPPPVALVDDEGEPAPRAPRWRTTLAVSLLIILAINLAIRMVAVITRPVAAPRPLPVAGAPGSP